MPKSYGLRPIRHRNGVIRTDEYPIASQYNTSIFYGDPVTLADTGNITQAAAGGVIFGVFQGVSYKNSAGEIIWSRYWPASTTATEIRAAVILADSNIEWSVYDDGDSDFLTGADVGTCADIIVGTGSTITGQSSVMLDTSSAAAGAAQLKILRKLDKVGNDYGAANGAQVEMVVLINENFIGAAAGI